MSGLYIAIVVVLIIAIGYYIYKRNSDELPTPPVQPSTPGNPNPPSPPANVPSAAAIEQIQSNWNASYSSFFVPFTQMIKELWVAFQTLDTPMNKNDIDILKLYGYSGSYNTNLMEHYAPGDNDSAQYKTAHAAWSNAKTDVATLTNLIGITNSAYVPNVNSALNTSIESYTSSTPLSQFANDMASIVGITALFPLAANLGTFSATSAPIVGAPSKGLNIQIFLQYVYYIMLNSTNSNGNPSNWQNGASNTTPTDGLINLYDMLEAAHTAGKSFTSNSSTGITIYEAYVLIFKGYYLNIQNFYDSLGDQLNGLLSIADLYSPPSS
jgi:hypothetical protein